ncbi:MAG: YicC/YloC family endoribonuclease [Lysobacterales bacterium]
MTAFAWAAGAVGRSVLVVELRSVNHRYLELGLRLPEELRGLEGRLRERVAAQLRAARSTSASAGGRAGCAADAGTRHRGAGATRRRGTYRRGVPCRTPASTWLRYSWPGVMLDQDVDAAQLGDGALALVDRALDDMVSAREREGERLGVNIEDRLAAIEAIVAEVRRHLPEVRSALRAKFDARLAELRQPLEPGRIEQEVVLQLQRIDVDEELDRLAGHVSEVRRTMRLGEPAGRRLDFLMQEFNREANTLGSKSADPRTTRASVELKVLIEQIREQVQNLE